MTFTRITVDPARMGGMPCVRDLRFPVAVVAMVADGMTVDEILAEHPDLEADDIAESLRYAALALPRARAAAAPAGMRFLLDENQSPRGSTIDTSAMYARCMHPSRIALCRRVSPRPH